MGDCPKFKYICQIVWVIERSPVVNHLWQGRPGIVRVLGNEKEKERFVQFVENVIMGIRKGILVGR